MPESRIYLVLKAAGLGKHYLIYGVLLFCDDFTYNNPLFPYGSSGGCYMLLIGLPIQRRKSASSVHTTFSSPASFSTEIVLDFFIYDVIKSTAERFLSPQAKGS